MYTHPVTGRLLPRQLSDIPITSDFIFIIVDIYLACQSRITTNIHSSSGQSAHKSYDNIYAFSDTATFQSMYSMKQICLIFPIILGFSFSSIVFCHCFFVFPQGYMIYFMFFESFSHFTLFRRLCNPSVRFVQRFSVLLMVTMVAQKTSQHSTPDFCRCGEREVPTPLCFFRNTAFLSEFVVAFFDAMFFLCLGILNAEQFRNGGISDESFCHA